MSCGSKRSPRLLPILSACLALVACLIHTRPSIAQSISPELRQAEELLRQQERERKLRERYERSPDAHIETRSPKDAHPLLPHDESPCFKINTLRLRGSGAEQFQWLLDVAGKTASGIVDPPVHRCLGTQGINRVMVRMQNALIKHGFVTSRVLAAPQDLSGGVLELSLIPGRIRNIRFDNSTSRRATLWNAIPTSPGDWLNLRDIEQALENFQRVPTVETDIRIMPADDDEAGEPRPGDSDIVIQWKQSQPVRLSAGINNSGSDATGRYLGSLTLSVDHGLTLNDLFYLSASHSLGGGAEGPRATHGEVIHYSLPLGYGLLGWTSSSHRYHQQVPTITGAHRYRGESDSHELRFSRLAYRDAVRKTTMSLALWTRHSRNFINDTETLVQRRRMTGWEAGLVHREHLGEAVLDLNLAYRRGTGALGALHAAEEATGTGTSRPRLTRLGVQLTVPWKARDQHWLYSLSAQSQWAHTRLITQDQFAIGSRYTVRGFDEQNFLTAEHGWALRNEIGMLLGQSRHQLYAGIDHGRVGGPTTRDLVGRSLTGAAVGLRGTQGVLAYDLYIGTPLAKPDGFKTASATAGFSLNVSF